MEFPKGLGWIKMLFKVSLVLLILNSISLILTFVYDVDTTISCISFAISCIISISCLLIIGAQKDK